MRQRRSAPSSEQKAVADRSQCLEQSEQGTTLVEILVVLVIVSVLAATAIPFAQTSMQRRQEIALQETLRDVREAIDQFHDDWRGGRFESGQRGASKNGYPTDLDVLVVGMTVVSPDGEKRLRRYLRRIPENPLARGTAEGWQLIGYEQAGAPAAWDRRDVYDLRARTDRKALNGTTLAQW